MYIFVKCFWNPPLAGGGQGGNPIKQVFPKSLLFNLFSHSEGLELRKLTLGEWEWGCSRHIWRYRFIKRSFCKSQWIAGLCSINVTSKQLFALVTTHQGNDDWLCWKEFNHCIERYWPNYFDKVPCMQAQDNNKEKASKAFGNVPQQTNSTTNKAPKKLSLWQMPFQDK